MKACTLVTLSLLALSLALPGCSASGQSSLSRPPAQAKSVASTPTSQPAPVEVHASQTVSYQGISFSYPSNLASDIQVANQEAVVGEAVAPGWAAHPRFLQFNFLGYVQGKTANEPRIEVYPTAEYRTANEQAGKVIDALDALLKNRSLAASPDLPFLPLQNAKQAVHAATQFVRFQNGVGLRYVTQYNQGPLPPINNGRLVYTFQGLTADGKYYVSAVLPVSNSLLPEGDNSLPGSDFVERIPTPGLYTDYLAGIAHDLDAASPSSFHPDLGSLDAMVASLSVHDK